MYQWWVYLHLAGVFALLASHGASVILAFRLRTERDPQRVEAMLQLSGTSIRAFYASLGVLLAGGIGAAFDGELWGYGWIWASLVVLAVTIVAMYFVARPYYHRVRFVTSAMTEGSHAVTAQQFDALLRSPRSLVVIVIGFVGLAVILYLMLFKPALGIAPEAASTTRSAEAADVRIAADEITFSTERIEIEAGEAIVLAFTNRAAVPHNVAVAHGQRTILRGEVFSGPRTEVYEFGPLEAGSYVFRCDVHPEQMTGTLEAS